MSYNGYANYNTWNVMLWLNNDEGLYYAKQDYLDECANSGKDPSYRELISYLGFGYGDETNDGAGWLADDLDYGELDNILVDEMNDN